ncbi:ATP-binding protein [Paenibacillus dendritiformis]|uniref:ATP-binding protein n=1 Tax=Paenibacillus dendritiformis TaxID=130049 RepID=UPI00387E1913
MSLDIFAPARSVVAEGLQGKKILIYGSNNLGKTYQVARFDRPYFICFEKGLSAVNGIPFASINKWSDFKKVVRQFEKSPDKAKELYGTIAIDGADIMAKYCSKFVCDTHGVTRLKEGNNGYGLWSEFETELWEQLDKLVSLDFTVVFIAHETETEEGQKVPKGDKRLMPYIRDYCDFTIYLKSNGLDENGDVIYSTAYLAETPEFFARSRFTHVPKIIETFTAENLKDAIVQGIKAQSKEEGFELVTEQEKKETYKSVELDFDVLMEEIKTVGNQLVKLNKLDDLTGIAEKYLGVGVKVTDCKKNQVEVMSVILDEMKDLVKESTE